MKWIYYLYIQDNVWIWYNSELLGPSWQSTPFERELWTIHGAPPGTNFNLNSQRNVGLDLVTWKWECCGTCRGTRNKAACCKLRERWMAPRGFFRVTILIQLILQHKAHGKTHVFEMFGQTRKCATKLMYCGVCHVKINLESIAVGAN